MFYCQSIKALKQTDVFPELENNGARQTSKSISDVPSGGQVIEPFGNPEVQKEEDFTSDYSLVDATPEMGIPTP